MPGVTASRTYQPFDLIYEEEAFAYVLTLSNRDECCDFCCKGSEDLITCEGCSIVKYCGTECMERSLLEHRVECGNMHKLEDVQHEDLVRLLSRVIFKIKGKDWKTIKRNVLGNDVSFDDLDDHYEEFLTNPRIALSYKEIRFELELFIGPENVPELDVLAKIIGKVKYGSGSFTTKTEIFCFGLSVLTHECIPNSNVDSYDTALKVWAARTINGGTEKITVSRRCVLNLDLWRSPTSPDNFEICNCAECSLPYGESVLTKVLDEKKAYSVIRQTENVLKQAEVISSFNRISANIPNMGGEDSIQHELLLYVLIQRALKRHEGVLGPTNALHLKLLATEAGMVGLSNEEKRQRLKELVNLMITVFGENYSDLVSVYKRLIYINLRMENMAEIYELMKKIEKLEVHLPENLRSRVSITVGDD